MLEAITRQLSAVAYEFGPFRLDVGSRQLLRGEPVPLTPKVFQTLLVLLECRDRVLSKDELMRAIWPDSFVSEDSLTQSIWALRRALGDDTSRPEFIATIPRRGYRFVAAVTEIPSPDLPEAAAVASPVSDEIAPTDRPAPQPAPIVGPAPHRRSQLLIAGVVAGVICGALGLAALPTIGRAPAHLTSLRFTLEPPDGYDLVSGGVVSSDGHHIVYAGRDTGSGETRLFVRAIDSPEARAVSGTDGALAPFWSPDDRFIAFLVQNTLKRVDLVRGGSAETIATVSNWPIAGSWATSGRILCTDRMSGLYVISAFDHAVQPVEPVTTSEIGYRWPQFLPDGEHFLYYVISNEPSRGGTFVGSLASRTRVRLLDASHLAVTFASPDRLLFVRDGTLFTQRFDLDDFRLQGEAFPLVSALSTVAVHDETLISASDNGLLAFRSAADDEHLMWFDRSGKKLGAAAGARTLRNPILSPDNRQALADSSLDGVWLLDLDRGSSTEVVADGKVAMWSPDGTSIAYTAGRREGIEDIYTRSIHQPDEDRVLISNTANTAPATIRLDDWSRDGRYIVFLVVDPRTRSDLWVFPTSGDRTPRPFLQTTAREMQGRISPDSRWIAYSSDESGEWEIYLQSFPLPGWKRRVSLNGGVQPQWRADGDELFYIARNHTLMTVDVSIRDREPRLGHPRALFRVPTSQSPERLRNHYVASNDGQRFLVDTATRDSQSQQILVIANWSARIDAAH